MFLSFGKYCVKKPKIPLFLGFIIMVLGLLSVFTISKESTPYIEYGVVTVTTVNPGVSAEDIDKSITRKIENKLSFVSGIDTMKSTSTEGVSNIVLTLETDVPIYKVVSDIRSAVDDAKADLPSNLPNDPRVSEIDSSKERPFMKVALISNDVSIEELSEIAEKLKSKLEDIVGVGDVQILGKVDTEVKIFLDKQKVESLHLSYNQIKHAISLSERNISMGTFIKNSKEYSLKFKGESDSIEDLKNIVLGKVGTIGPDFSAHSIFLKDIATIQFGPEKNPTITRFNKKQGIVLKISPKSGSDIFVTEPKVYSVLQRFLDNSEYKANHVETVVFSKVTDVMRKDYWNLFTSFVFSIAIVLISIFFFIGVKEGIVASLVIPISFLGTVFVLNMFGRTMNFMTNFAMILALGILVDTAIVMVEGTVHYIKKGFHPRDAALQSFIEFRSPLVSGMLTTLIVFLPLFFLPGIVGKFLSFIPITVTIVLTVALFVSLFIIPAISALVLRKEDQSPEYKKSIFYSLRESINKKINTCIEWYVRLLQKILVSPIRKYGIFLSTVLLFIGTLFLPTQFEMFPTKDSDRIAIKLLLPEGTESKKVIDTLRVLHMEDVLENLPETSVFSVTIHKNIAEIDLELQPFKDREEKGLRTSSELETFLIEKFHMRDKDIILQVQREKKGPKSSFPVGFNIKIADSHLLQEGKNVTKEVTALLQTIDGTQGVTNSLTEIPGEYDFLIDKEKAFLQGINPLDIPSSIRGMVYGDIVAVFKKQGFSDDIDIRLAFKETQVSDIQKILSIEIAKGVKLSDIVTVQKKSGIAEITRDDGDLVFTVSSFLTETGNAEEVTKSFFSLLKRKISSGDFVLPKGITIEDASENKNNEAVMKAMMNAFVLAILMIFFVLVLQFESYTPPLLILQTVLFAQIGVAIGLYFTGTEKSMSYMLGLISLSGIVVNDAIILVDKIRNNVFSGTFSNKIEAILDAGKTRFIPVVLTTLTTSAGIFPLIFIDSFWEGLAYTIIFGLSVSSFLTLFLIPIGYMLFQKK